MILSAHDVELVKQAFTPESPYFDWRKAMTRFVKMSCALYTGKDISWETKVAWRGLSIRLQVCGLNILSEKARLVWLGDFS